MPQTEITEPVSVLDKAGRPQNFGWARSSILSYDHNLLSAPHRSISEGDRYVLVSSSHVVCFEILDDGYLGYHFLSVVPLREKTCFSKTLLTNFSLGCLDLPINSDIGSIKFKQKKGLINFACMDGGVKLIKVDIPDFSRHQGLRGEVVLTPPPGAESLLTNMTWWRKKGEAFLLSRKSPWYFAEGVIQFGSSDLVFTRGEGWGIFDWTRGVRPPSDLRFWAVGCGLSGDHQVAFNTGYSSADSSAGTENAFFLDGKLHKLDQVSFHIPSGRLVPWRFTSNDSRFEMTFTPQQERDENHQMFFYSLKQRQLFGFFSGKVILDDGSKFEFKEIAGMAERRKSRL